MAKAIRKTRKKVKIEYVKKCKNCGKFVKKQVIPIKFEFTKEEVKEIKSKIYLTELQEQIFDLKMEGNLTEDGIALEINKSKSTVYYQWKKVKKKILKVI